MRPQSPHTPVADFMTEALKHATQLSQERQSRPTGRHASDERIASEVATTLFHLGRYRKGMVDQLKRWREAITESEVTLQNLDEISGMLTTELEIACNTDTPATV